MCEYCTTTAAETSYKEAHKHKSFPSRSSRNVLNCYLTLKSLPLQTTGTTLMFFPLLQCILLLEIKSGIPKFIAKMYAKTRMFTRKQN